MEPIRLYEVVAQQSFILVLLLDSWVSLSIPSLRSMHTMRKWRRKLIISLKFPRDPFIDDVAFAKCEWTFNFLCHFWPVKSQLFHLFLGEHSKTYRGWWEKNPDSMQVKLRILLCEWLWWDHKHMQMRFDYTPVMMADCMEAFANQNGNIRGVYGVAWGGGGGGGNTTKPKGHCTCLTILLHTSQHVKLFHSLIFFSF